MSETGGESEAVGPQNLTAETSHRGMRPQDKTRNLQTKGQARPGEPAVTPVGNTVMEEDTMRATERSSGEVCRWWKQEMRLLLLFVIVCNDSREGAYWTAG